MFDPPFSPSTSSRPRPALSVPAPVLASLTSEHEDIPTTTPRSYTAHGLTLDDTSYHTPRVRVNRVHMTPGSSNSIR